MKTNKTIIRLLSVLFAIPFCLSVFIPAAADEGSVVIRTAEDLIRLSENCSLDTWSQDKTVELMCNIDLTGSEFKAIPTFGGKFNGNDHKITGFHIENSVSQNGFILDVQPNAVISNLSVSGNITGKEADIIGGIAAVNNGKIIDCSFTGYISADCYVGGIAGKNSISGEISLCNASGEINGTSFTGGITGENSGAVTYCTNNMSVNVNNSSISLVIETDGLLNLPSFMKTINIKTASDTGGIAGYSSGLLLNCKNEGDVGYPHVGYNVGGIAGRQSGYLVLCSNSASVRGRKDVGGICGQSVPCINTVFNGNTLSALVNELGKIQSIVNDMLDKTDASASSISSGLNNLCGYLNTARDSSKNLISMTLNPLEYYNVRECIDENNNCLEEKKERLETKLDENKDYLDNRKDKIKDHLEQRIENAIIADTPFEHAENIREDIEYHHDDLNEKLENKKSKLEELKKEKEEKVSIIKEEAQTVKDWVCLVSADYCENASALEASVNGIGNELGGIMSALNNSSAAVSEGLRAINDEFGVIIGLISNMLYNGINISAQSLIDDLVDDVSDYAIYSATEGKAEACINYGSVNGDINTGGIAGSMAIEYDIDPEDEIKVSGNYAYRAKSILLNCKSYGPVTSRKNCAGGIVGNMDLGTVYGCEAYGSIESETGNYVGGVAGLSSSSIRNSYAKCTLSGKDYIGGIAGKGRRINHSRSFVQITDYVMYAGAIAGVSEGVTEYNYFVSDKLAGIDRISYKGKAEPMSYEDFCKLDGLPESFMKLNVTFMADGKNVKTYSFDYGDSLSLSEIPALPEKEGYYGKWSTDNFKDLTFDLTVYADYSQYKEVLASELTRDGGGSVVIALGSFTDNNELIVTEETDKTDSSKQIYTVSVTGDCIVNEIRFLPVQPDRNYSVFIIDGDSSEKIQTEKFGRYISFKTDQKDITFSAVSESNYSFFLRLSEFTTIFYAILIFIRRKV